VGNLTGVTSLRRSGLAVGLPLGLVFLALVLVLGVFLPKAEGSESVELPDALPGGYTALDDPSRPVPDGVQGDLAKTQAQIVKTTEGQYDDAYGTPVAFRIYSDDSLQVGIGVTVFAGDGGAFGPEFGSLQGASVSKEGDAVCTTLASQAGMTQSGQAATPSQVTCQLPDHEHTIQVSAQGLSLDDTVKLTHEVADSI
jgi:hypothetical protein